MKHLLSTLLLATTLTVSAQSVKVSSKVLGSTVNVTIPTDKIFNLDAKTPKTEKQQIGESALTSNKAIYKEVEYPVYATTKGKLFIVFPNKENTGYSKKYIKQE